LSILSSLALSGRVAFVPQEDSSVLYDQLTVEENVLFAALLFNTRGWSGTIPRYSVC
jgi:ABC-type multidrug transport system ATPase subunit